MGFTYKIIESTIQTDGIQRVQVAFTDHLGKEHRRHYDFPKNADVDKEIQTRKFHVEQGLKDQEIESAVGKIEAGKTFELQYASEAELKLKLQERIDEKQDAIDALILEKGYINAKLEVK